MSFRKLLLAITLLGSTAPSFAAGGVYVKQTTLPFPEAMAELQMAIEDNGYQLSRVQRVDYGLKQRGFEADKYRVVFYGKADEIKHLGATYPQLAPLLPLKITILEQDDGVKLVAINPQRLARLYTEPELQATFDRWNTDVLKILDDATK